jgi:hypothetical protein
MTTISGFAPHAADAEERARARVGDAYQPGWCLRFIAHDVYGVLPLVDGAKFDETGGNSAADYWHAAVERGTVVKATAAKDLPQNSAVFWLGEEGEHGHVAFYTSGEKIISTDLPEIGFIGEAHLGDVEEQWGYKLVGAVLVDGNGISLEPGEMPAPKYKVSNPDGARGTELISRSSAEVDVVPVGKAVKVDHLEQIPGTLDIRAVVKRKGGETFYDYADLEVVE